MRRFLVWTFLTFACLSTVAQVLYTKQPKSKSIYLLQEYFWQYDNDTVVKWSARLYLRRSDSYNLLDTFRSDVKYYEAKSPALLAELRDVFRVRYDGGDIATASALLVLYMNEFPLRKLHLYIPYKGQSLRSAGVTAYFGWAPFVKPKMLLDVLRKFKPVLK